MAENGPISKSIKICGRCQEAPLGTGLLDSIFRLQCNGCFLYRLKETKNNWKMKKKCDLSSCKVCSESFRLESPQIPHPCTRVDIVVYVCPFCSKQLESKKSMNKHVEILHIWRIGHSEAVIPIEVVAIPVFDNRIDHNYCKRDIVKPKKDVRNRKTFTKRKNLKTKDTKNQKTKKTKNQKTKETKNQKETNNEKTKERKNEKTKETKKRKKLDFHLKNYCKECNKLYARRSGYKYHMITRIGVKNFECEICLKKFLTVGHLKEHKNIHLGIKKFECLACGKKFLRRGDFNRHVSRHNLSI